MTTPRPNQRRPRDNHERLVARLLDELKIPWEYEPHLLPTGMTGRNRTAIQPDFYLPNQSVGPFRFYLEVTGKCPETKLFKIKPAETLNKVIITLIGPQELIELNHFGTTSLHEYISAGRRRIVGIQPGRFRFSLRPPSAA